MPPISGLYEFRSGEDGGLCAHCLFVLFLVFGSLLLPPTSRAQRAPQAFVAGLQAGQPGGVTAKLYRLTPIAYDAVLTTDADDFITLYVHRLWERPLPDSPLHGYVGPGLLLGGTQLRSTARVQLGVSTEVGVNFYAEQFEVFLHATPNVHFLPTPTATLGGSVGLRYRFYQP